MELECHAPLHGPDGGQACGNALQIPLGPAQAQQQLEDLVVGAEDGGGEQDVQGPGGRVPQEQGLREGPVSSSRGAWQGRGDCHSGRRTGH